MMSNYLPVLLFFSIKYILVYFNTYYPLYIYIKLDKYYFLIFNELFIYFILKVIYFSKILLIAVNKKKNTTSDSKSICLTKETKSIFI